MELKAYLVYTPMDSTAEGMYELDAINLAGEKVYLADEADKVIAEKDEKIDELEERIDELQKATDSAWSKVNVMYDELRHHKYKRCLAMARECINGEIKLKRVKMRDMNDHQFWQFDNDYWLKWNKRWLELAEKFKEAK